MTPPSLCLKMCEEREMGDGCKGLGVQVRGHRIRRGKDEKKWRGEERRQQSRETEKWELKSIKWKILAKFQFTFIIFMREKLKNITMRG